MPAPREPSGEWGALATRGGGGRGTATAEAPLVWAPSQEKVVWNWPVIEDRLVEDYE